MLTTKLKPKDEILALAGGVAAVIICRGCSEVCMPDAQAAVIMEDLSRIGSVLAVIDTDYICSPEHLMLQLGRYADKIDAAGAVLVFSCGVGVQTVAAALERKQVFSACDTFPLPGHQGVTPLEFDCNGCGNCHLNSTGGICPVTSCPKSLTNGQCGGSKGGKCEVDKDLDCSWDVITRQGG